MQVFTGGENECDWCKCRQSTQILQAFLVRLRRIGENIVLDTDYDKNLHVVCPYGYVL